MLLLALTTRHALAADPTPAEAYNEGITLGTDANNPGLAQDAATAQGLPNYNTNPPEAAYFDPDSNAAAANAGQSASSTSDEGTIARQSDNVLSNEASLTTGTDPIFQRAAPTSPLGGTYTSCTTVTASAGGTASTQTCNATPPYEHPDCDKTLTVDVEVTQSCVVGTVTGPVQTYALIHADKGWYCSTWTSVECGPELNGIHRVRVGHTGQFAPSFSGNGSTSFEFMLTAATPGTQWSGTVNGCVLAFNSEGCDANGNCTLKVSNGYTSSRIQFPLSRYVYTETDTWQDGCSAIEARVQ
jgi:hypothetical protein